jgi:hypothetical protein
VEVNKELQLTDTKAILGKPKKQKKNQGKSNKRY